MDLMQLVTEALKEHNLDFEQWIDEGISVEQCSKAVDDFVKNLRRKMNIYIAVDIKREETRVKTVEKA